MNDVHTTLVIRQVMNSLQRFPFMILAAKFYLSSTDSIFEYNWGSILKWTLRNPFYIYSTAFVQYNYAYEGSSVYWFLGEAYFYGTLLKQHPESQKNLIRLGGSNLAQTPILNNIPIRVNHALHAREPNRWIICSKVNSVVKQGKDQQEFRGCGGGAPNSWYFYTCDWSAEIHCRTHFLKLLRFSQQNCIWGPFFTAN